MYWSRPTGTDNVTIDELYYKLKRLRKEEERKALFTKKSGGAVGEATTGPKPAKPSPLPEQKAEADVAPLTGLDSDENDSTHANDGSDNESPAQ